MGIQNKDGALYFATGIDNSGLYSGRQEAMGIIKAMAGELPLLMYSEGLALVRESLLLKQPKKHITSKSSSSKA